MLLAIDIGNTNTTLGVFGGEELLARFRLHSQGARTADEYAALLSSLLTNKGLSEASLDGVAMACVVPPIGDAVRDFSRRHLNIEPLVVTAETDIGMPLHYIPPTAAGADRIVNAVAARALYGAAGNLPCVIIDYGTATKLDAVSADGAYRGGAILPGIGISLDALYSRAALLSRIELTAPGPAIGATTADALRSGILFGFAAQTDGMVARFRRELGEGARVIATGGIAPLIAPYAAAIEIVEPNLTLIGLRMLYERLVAPPPAI